MELALMILVGLGLRLNMWAGSMHYHIESRVYVSEDGGTIVPEELVFFAFVIIFAGIVGLAITMWGTCRYPC